MVSIVAMDPEDGKMLVHVLAAVLEKLAQSNDSAGGGGAVTKFHAMRAPAISIKDYLERIFKYASCSSECFVLALVYIDRLIQRNNFVINSLNAHRVVITSIMLAAKFFDDQYFNNAYYAKVGGVPLAEINSLELEYLFLINFSLHVTPEAFRKYYMELANHTVADGAFGGNPPTLVLPEEQRGPGGGQLVYGPPAPAGGGGGGGSGAIGGIGAALAAGGGAGGGVGAGMGAGAFAPQQAEPLWCC